MANIFAQYLKPPKSIVEFGAELDSAEANRLALAKARREGVQAEQDIAEQNAFKKALAGGLDLTTPEGFSRAAAMAPKLAGTVGKDYAAIQKSGVETDTSRRRGKLYTAQEAASEFKLRADKAQQAYDDISGMTSPDQVKADVSRRLQAGELSPDHAMAIMEHLPPPGSPPEAFQQFIKDMGNRALDAKKRADIAHQMTMEVIAREGHKNTAEIARLNREAMAPQRAAQTRLTNLVAEGRSPATLNVPIGGGMSATVPGPQGAAPPQGAVLPTPEQFVGSPEYAALSPVERESFDRVRAAEQQGQIIRTTDNVIPSPADREIARLPRPANPQAATGAQQMAPTGTAAPLVSDVKARPVFDASKYPPNPGESRDQYQQRLGNLQRDFEAAQNRAEVRVNVLGQNASTQLSRVLIGGNQVVKALGNIVNLPMNTASTGIFGGRVQGKSLFEAGKETLTNAMTTQDVQTYNTLATGLTRSLAAIETAGLAPPNSILNMMSGVLLKEGDSNFTKLLKMAEIRQIVDSAYEVILADPRVADSQKVQAQRALEEIRRHVPFTVNEVQKLGQVQEQNPNATLKDVMASAKAGAGPAVGEERNINGVPAVWDGKGWKRKQ
jgi:hypothetical protein